MSQLAWWRKGKATEVKVKRTANMVQWADINITHETEDESRPEAQQQPKTNVGLYAVYAQDTTKSDIRITGEDPEQTIYVASDGSVLDPQLGGSYA